MAPGVMAYTYFKVENKGSVALKYALESYVSDYNWIKDSQKDLRDVIKFAVLDGEVGLLAT